MTCFENVWSYSADLNEHCQTPECSFVLPEPGHTGFQAFQVQITQLSIKAQLNTVCLKEQSGEEISS